MDFNKYIIPRSLGVFDWTRHPVHHRQYCARHISSREQPRPRGFPIVNIAIVPSNRPVVVYLGRRFNQVGWLDDGKFVPCPHGLEAHWDPNNGVWQLGRAGNDRSSQNTRRYVNEGLETLARQQYYGQNHQAITSNATGQDIMSQSKGALIAGGDSGIVDSPQAGQMESLQALPNIPLWQAALPASVFPWNAPNKFETAAFSPVMQTALPQSVPVTFAGQNVLPESPAPRNASCTAETGALHEEAQTASLRTISGNPTAQSILAEDAAAWDAFNFLWTGDFPEDIQMPSPQVVSNGTTLQDTTSEDMFPGVSSNSSGDDYFYQTQAETQMPPSPIVSESTVAQNPLMGDPAASKGWEDIDFDEFLNGGEFAELTDGELCVDRAVQDGFNVVSRHSRL